MLRNIYVVLSSTEGCANCRPWGWIIARSDEKSWTRCLPWTNNCANIANRWRGGDWKPVCCTWVAVCINKSHVWIIRSTSVSRSWRGPDESRCLDSQVFMWIEWVHVKSFFPQNFRWTFLSPNFRHDPINEAALYAKSEGSYCFVINSMLLEHNLRQFLWSSPRWQPKPNASVADGIMSAPFEEIWGKLWYPLPNMVT